MTYVYEVSEVTYTENFTEKVKKSTLYNDFSVAVAKGIDVASKRAHGEAFQVLDERTTGFGNYLKIYDPKETQFMKGSWAVYIKRREVK